MIKGLTSSLSVEHGFNQIPYTWRPDLLYDLKCIKLKVQREGKLDGIPYCVEMKVNVLLWKQSSSSRG